MSRASAAQTVLPLGNQSQGVGEWDQVLMAAFADPDRASGFLPQAEEAVRGHPGDGLILLLAATAALLDQNPERAQVFLKRFSKRFVAIAAYHLLRALVLEQWNNLASARSVLEANGLTSGFDALEVFPGGWTRRTWLFRRHDRIFGRNQATTGRRAVPNADTRHRVKVKASGASRKRAPTPAIEALVTPVAPPGLPVIDVAIPFSADFDLAPLLTAMQKPPDNDGAGHGLRERLAHLGLAQGFDELLCPPHLRGIQTFWYQVETVRKVLKQFRGRVLLADEVACQQRFVQATRLDFGQDKSL
jgi:hypothetical protein